MRNHLLSLSLIADSCSIACADAGGLDYRTPFVDFRLKQRSQPFARDAGKALARGKADLQADRPDPRLMMPSSFKGRGQKKITHRPVPITPALAAALKNAKGDRPADAPLLRKRDGTAWQATSTVDHRDLFRHAVERAELGVAGVTSYALRQ